ncbi:uncharacterized protein N7500_003779 [Penicillium coprophilum]|uniref:uncharacterized protein n=1 Tax=Penicillium coprophilum TaxID=36646 RepID=UPI002394FDD6|nr:uncharacterized protein N7500_003779 [Penicillium coprophilum]KAJ5170996.1 hypothetical protein N7500_003779 [Penicillium coprophilum]
MAPETNKPKAPASGPATAEIAVSQETKVVPKASDEVFLLTMLSTGKVDFDTAAKNLGINKQACRMRLLRLQQKYGLKHMADQSPKHD